MLELQEWEERYSCLVLSGLYSYFVKKHSDTKVKYIKKDIIHMTEFRVYNMFVAFDGHLFQHGIQVGTNCAPLFADLFLYSC